MKFKAGIAPQTRYPKWVKPVNGERSYVLLRRRLNTLVRASQRDEANAIASTATGDSRTQALH
ncbi:hypothetical protein [Burkholderia ubonensis]|uniref:hypothetical protein n=1 Tax=Burkholderia ubonensis TaxID=101571 RepID=UPI000B02097D|nr:hypothetical protein [Burkholderia ubonensis]